MWFSSSFKSVYRALYDIVCYASCKSYSIVTFATYCNERSEISMQRYGGVGEYRDCGLWDWHMKFTATV